MITGRSRTLTLTLLAFQPLHIPAIGVQPSGPRMFHKRTMYLNEGMRVMEKIFFMVLDIR